jgi:hypothetical protein
MLMRPRLMRVDGSVLIGIYLLYIVLLVSLSPGP